MWIMFFSFLKTQILKIKNLWKIVFNDIKGEKSKIKKLKKIVFIPYRTIKVLFWLELIIPYIEIVLTTFCTLRCKWCSALIEYNKNPKHYSLEDNIKAIQRLVDSSDSIMFLKLLWWEPLCYPYLYSFVKFLKEQDKIKKIVITTNWTMTIKDQQLINIFKNNDKFNFSISNYWNTSKNFNNLIKQLEDNNIKYTVMKTDYNRIDYGNLNKRNRTEKQLREQYYNCARKKRSLLNGKLFQCYRCSNATNLKLVPLIKKDYIDLLDKNISNNQLRKKLYAFIYKYTDYIESCNYCDCTKDPKIIDKGKQNNNE